MNKLKGIISVSLAVVICLALAGCMNTNRQPEPTVAPEMTAAPPTAPADTVVPMATDTGLTALPTSGPTVFDWVQNVRTVEDGINRISEISKSRVIVNGTMALVGVEFADQYKGELTDRIREMVAAEVKNADSAIQKVSVTAEANDVAQINTIADQIQSGAPAQQFEQEIDAIVRNVSTLS